MTWLKVEDTIVEDPGNADLSADAWCVWLFGNCYSSRTLSDGYIPTTIAMRFGPLNTARRKRAIEELRKSGLWSVEPDGIRIVAWLTQQRSRQTVEQQREAGRARKAAWRARSELDGDAADRPGAVPSESQGCPDVTSDRVAVGPGDLEVEREAEARVQSAEDGDSQVREHTPASSREGSGEGRTIAFSEREERRRKAMVDAMNKATTSLDKARVRAAFETGHAGS